MKNKYNNKKSIFSSIYIALLFSIVLSGMGKLSLITFAATNTINGNVITDNYNREEDGDELTFSPDEVLNRSFFFEEGDRRESKYTFLIFIIPIIFVVFCYIMTKPNEKNIQAVEMAVPYPPEGFNSLEVGFLYKGIAKYDDVVSLLLYLANKGYIKISEIYEQKSKYPYKNFRITKLKEYDGKNSNEKIFLDGMFSKGSYSQITGLSEVTLIELIDNFYVTLKQIEININTKENETKIFEESSYKRTKYISHMIIVTLCLISLYPAYIFRDFFSLIGLPFMLLGLLVVDNVIFGRKIVLYMGYAALRSSAYTKIAGLLFVCMFISIPFSMTILPILLKDKLFLCAYIVGIMCIIGMYICKTHLPRRTPYGNQMFEKIRDFKKFVETEDKRRLQAQAIQNQHYIYNILPYTYALGISSKWMDNLGTAQLQAPDWYDSDKTFNIISFRTFVDSMMFSALSCMTTNPTVRRFDQSTN